MRAVVSAPLAAGRGPSISRPGVCAVYRSPGQGALTPEMLGLLGVYKGVASGSSQLASLQLDVRRDLFKLGLTWRLVRDFALSASWSTSFHAPGVSDLYGSQYPAAEVAMDPCFGKLDAKGNFLRPSDLRRSPAPAQNRRRVSLFTTAQETR